MKILRMRLIRHFSALLNLHHTLEGVSHTHIVVVTKTDMDLYITKWTNHIIMVLPESAESQGFGVSSNFSFIRIFRSNFSLIRTFRTRVFNVVPK
jgi:hypothetical protein